MPRQKRKSNKRSLPLGIALEVATLLAILLLARPDWIARGIQIVERHQGRQHSAAPSGTESTSPPEQTTSITSDSSQLVLPAAGVFPTLPPMAQAEIASKTHAPAIVVPAREWLPGYFDVVQFQDHPPLRRNQMPYGRPPYRLSTPMHPWSGQPEQHF